MSEDEEPPAGVHVETLKPPCEYSLEQIERAAVLAQLLNRGKLVLTEPPEPPRR